MPNLKDCEAPAPSPPPPIDDPDGPSGGGNGSVPPPALPSNLCPAIDGRPQWRCRSGMCVALKMACDGEAQCDDGTDEIDGCRMFGGDDTEDFCPSWYGRRHVPCANSSIKVGIP